MELLNLPTYLFRIKEDQGKKYIFDEVRRRFVSLTPEEWVRQNMIRFLISAKNFPLQLMSIEKGFRHQRRKLRYDLLIYNRSGQPAMIIECKAPGVEINQQVFDQVVRYNMNYNASYLLITNGIKHYCCSYNIENQQYRFLQDIPDFSTL
jgi:hypothetical protein